MKYIVQPVIWNNYKRKWNKIAKKYVIEIDSNGKMSNLAEALFCTEKNNITPFSRAHLIQMNKAYNKDVEGQSSKDKYFKGEQGLI